MRPRLHDPAIIKDANHIRVAHGRQAMRNRDCDPVARSRSFVESILDDSFRLRVQSTCRLIEEK